MAQKSRGGKMRKIQNGTKFLPKIALQWELLRMNCLYSSSELCSIVDRIGRNGVEGECLVVAGSGGHAGAVGHESGADGARHACNEQRRRLPSHIRRLLVPVDRRPTRVHETVPAL